MKKDFVFFKSSSPAGDLLAMLAGIKQLCGDLDKKAIIYQRLNWKCRGYQGANHPFKDGDGDEIAMNEYMFNMLRPLLLAQDYIEDYIIFEGQTFEYDLDQARMEKFVNQPLGSLNRWIFYVYPQMACDLSKPWLKVSYRGQLKGKIIINQTDRYRNYLLTYFFLKNYEKDIVFAGLPEEHANFCKQWGVEVPYLDVNDFLELAESIQVCKFFMGNASACFQLAEALKVPRLLEICPMMPNVIPVGENAFDAYHQTHIEYYFDKLFKN